MRPEPEIGPGVLLRVRPGRRVVLPDAVLSGIAKAEPFFRLLGAAERPPGEKT
jgi:hypothetical protein